MIGPLVIGGDVWRVRRADPGDPVLVDRTGFPRVAVTDPGARCVWVSRDLSGPFLDRVLLHEAAHCAMVSHGLLDGIRASLPPSLWVTVEEWACNLLADHGREVIQAVSAALPRAVMVRGSDG